MKKCSHCLEVKETCLFNKHPTTKDGFLHICRPCQKAYKAKHREDNPESYKQKNKERYKKAVEKNPNLGKEKYAKGAGAEVKERGYKRNPNGLGRDLEKRRRASSQYQHRRRALKAKVEETEFDLFVFEEACILRDMRNTATGFLWHVDHIVPLRHEAACGLHNGVNLQVVPAKWNIDKRHHTCDTYYPIRPVEHGI